MIWPVTFSLASTRVTGFPTTVNSAICLLPKNCSSRSNSSKRQVVFGSGAVETLGSVDVNGLNLLNLFAPYHGSRILHRLDDLRVTCTTAKVARECVTNFILGRVLILVEQRFGHHQHPRGAVAALSAAVLNKSLLDRV